MKSVGEQLQLGRLYKKWTLQAAAKATKIKAERLSDLEKNDFSKFSSAAYARGFVRIYARSLGLDERKILAQLDGKLNEEEEEIFVSAPAVEYIPEQVEMSAPLRAGRLGQKMIFVIGILFAISILITLVKAYQSGFFSGKDSEVAARALPVEPSSELTSESPEAATNSATATDSPSETSAPPRAMAVQPMIARAIPVNNAPPVPVAIPVAVPVTIPVNPASETHQLTLKSHQESWVRVNELKDGQEKNLFEGVIKAGEYQDFQGARFTIKIEVPAGIDVILDGVNYGPYSDSEAPETFTVPNPTPTN